MKNFDRSKLTGSLGRVAEQELAITDKLIDRRPPSVEQGYVTLRRVSWLAMEKGLHRATNGQISLRTHLYRGVELRCGK